MPPCRAWRPAADPTRITDRLGWDDGAAGRARRAVRVGHRRDSRAGAAPDLRVRRPDRAARRSPRSSRCPESTAEVQAVVRICNEARIPFVARGAGTGLSGGALPVAEGIVISLARMTRILEIDLDARPRRRRAGRHEPRRHEGGRGRRLLLRARPVVPAGVHDRRQRRRELGRRPLPQVRLHRQPRARRRDRAARRRARRALGVGRRARTCSGAFVGSEGTLGIATKLTLRVLAGARHGAHAARRLRRTPTTRARRSRATIAAGILPAAIEMMDAITIEAAEAAVQARLPARLRRDPDRRARRAGSAGRRRLGAGRGALPRERRARDPHRRRRSRPRGDLARPQGGVRGDGPRQPELLRAGRRRAAHEAAGGAAPDRRALAASTGCASATSSTPATATCIRSSSTTSAIDGRGRARRAASRRRSSRPASTPAARSPASTASAPTRRARCR